MKVVQLLHGKLPLRTGIRMDTVIVGHFTEHEKKAMRSAAGRAGASCVFVQEVARALTIIESMDHPPRCVFASLTVDLDGLLERLRNSSDLYSVPVIALVSCPGSESYLAANRLGADDSIPQFDSSGMTRRLTNLLEGGPTTMPPPGASRLLVAVVNEERCKAIRRSLHAAGYDADLLEGGPTQAPHGAVSDPLSFFVDGATEESGANRRSSRRIQHAAIATFCTSRSFERTYALTDNISRLGLYLRTLDPPATGSEVRVEVRDRYGEVLQLRGAVTWRHAPCKVGGTTCHGFAMSIDRRNSSKSDLDKFETMYECLLEKLAARRSKGRSHPVVQPDPSVPPAVAAVSHSGKTSFH